MNTDLRDHIEGCKAAHRKLFDTLVEVSDDVISRPSRLPGWTVGHVLTHLARNADSQVRRMEGAARNEVVDQYPGGYKRRATDIAEGAGRSAVEILADVAASALAVEAAYAALPEEAWGRYTRAVSGVMTPADMLPFSRWREVEIHHIDLGLGFGYRDWSDGFVAGELPRALATVPGRLTDAEARRRLCAWLIDREPEPGTMSLDSWG